MVAKLRLGTNSDLWRHRRAEQREVREQICLQHRGQRHGFIDWQHSMATDRDDFGRGRGHGF